MALPVIFAAINSYNYIFEMGMILQKSEGIYLNINTIFFILPQGPIIVHDMFYKVSNSAVLARS